MEYFLSHIGYILIAGILTGVIAAVAGLLGAKNSREASAEDSVERKNNMMACSECSISAICFGYNSDVKSGERADVTKMVKDKACEIEKEEKLENHGNLTEVVGAGKGKPAGQNR